MRLSNDILNYLLTRGKIIFPGVDIYLFGSRVDDDAKGGDIDLLLLSNNKLSKSILREFRVEFYKRFGWQKIDLVNFTKDENSTFKNIALQNAIKISENG